MVLVAGAAVVLASLDRAQLALGLGLPDRQAPRMLVIAHRGDLDQYPEDTLEAIRAAVDLGVDGIEFDVHVSSDGTWFVIHDDTLDRTTDGSGAVAALPASVIDGAVIDGGLGFLPEHDGLRVPRLAAVLDTLRDYEGLLYLDLQHTQGGDPADLARMLQGRQATVLVRSVDDIRAIMTVDPDLTAVARAWVAPEAVDGFIMDAIAEATVERVRSAGRPVSVYVEDAHFNEDESNVIRRAWAAGVFAFLSKHPADALEVVVGLADGG
jgi:glycerophosphoryl diester phosphodiesterase